MKTTVVLGASSGVGNAICRALHCDTQRAVVGFHRNHHKEEAALLTNQLPYVNLHIADVGTMFSGVVNAVELLQAHYPAGSIDSVVHSLSGATVGPTLKTSPMDVEKTFARLAHSYLWWVQTLLKTNLLAPHATFIALSNPCPDFYLRNTGVIGAAKAALEAYVKTIAAELFGEHTAIGVRFSTVVTPALETVMPKSIPGLQRLHAFIQPGGVMQTCDDIGGLVRYVVQSRSAQRMLNGSILDATGGAPGMLMDYAFNTASRL